MTNLSLEQMERVEGSISMSCVWSLVGVGVGLLAIIGATGGTALAFTLTASDFILSSGIAGYQCSDDIHGIE